jgi:hypothetical protein
MNTCDSPAIGTWQMTNCKKQHTNHSKHFNNQCLKQDTSTQLIFFNIKIASSINFNPHPTTPPIGNTHLMSTSHDKSQKKDNQPHDYNCDICIYFRIISRHFLAFFR